MGFPEAIARAQRDEMQGELLDGKRRLDEAVENLRAVGPHNVALTRGEYDRLIDYLVGARTSISLALDQIDESLARQAREQHQDELAQTEKEANPEEG